MLRTKVSFLYAPLRPALILCVVSSILCAPRDEEDYHVQHSDGSYEFGYENSNSFHNAKANNRNIVRGQFGGRNPKTGGIDVVQYTAGPRGYRPRGSNIVRKYDLSQVRRGPIGSRDDPYFDPNEDPSYEFAFKTRTYQKSESANKLGDVQGQYSYVDDIGERHNVEYIAGKNTGFHIKTSYPDSNPRAYGSLYFNGRGRPLPRGRTSIQRGLDGSYRFVSTGPDQRRTEQSDAHGNIRGSYTYLDDKGVQHSVHYIAGPQIGYRVLKNVKGPHLPSVFPFSGPNVVSDDFYHYLDEHSSNGDSGTNSDTNGDGNSDFYDDDGSSRPNRPTQRPSAVVPKPRPTSAAPGFSKPSYDYDLGDFGVYGDGSNLEDDLFGGESDSGGSTARPSTTRRPTSASTIGAGRSSSSSTSTYGDYANYDDSDLFDRDPSVSRPSPRPSISSSSRPTSLRPSYGDSSESTPPTTSSSLGDGTPGLSISSKQGGHNTIVTNLGDRTFSVPPGLSVHAHVQSIDLYPYESKVPSPADQFRAETTNQRSTTRRDVNPQNGDRIMDRSTFTSPPTTGLRDKSKSQQDDGEHKEPEGALGVSNELVTQTTSESTTTSRSETKSKNNE